MLLNLPKKDNNINLERKDHKEIIISVKDTGKGIETVTLPELFVKYFSQSDSGSGWGLFICKSIVELTMEKLVLKQQRWKRCDIYDDITNLFKVVISNLIKWKKGQENN